MLEIGNDQLLKTMRTMKWQEAKGKLNAVLSSYWPEYDACTGQKVDNGFEGYKKAMETFIHECEFNGYVE